MARGGGPHNAIRPHALVRLQYLAASRQGHLEYPRCEQLCTVVMVGAYEHDGLTRGERK